ncbi:MAG TPA: TetR/AcrR family transcriptional regulator [Micropruina sp.]|nr:TetR/AcrR family transcriptional regulator [Micropruina sp.]
MPKAIRSDTARNRRQIIKAAADLVAAEGPNVRMSDVAERAEVSLATAYRHFSSVDEALVQYRMDAGLKLYAHSVSSEARGLELLKDVSDYWITLVLRHGRVMVTTRSREGFLKRLRSGARYLTVAADALDEPIRQAAAELGLPDPGDEGMFLWNMMFDPREIFDMVETLGLTQEQVGQRLVGAFCGALQGWIHASSSRSQPEATTQAS